MPLQNSPTRPRFPAAVATASQGLMLSGWTTSLWEKGSLTGEAPTSSGYGRQRGMSQSKRNLLSPILCLSSVPETLDFLPTVLNLFSKGTRPEGKMEKAGSEMKDTVAPNQLWA